jgi:tetratricopeptide (TPR) repeat protein
MTPGVNEMELVSFFRRHFCLFLLAGCQLNLPEPQVFGQENNSSLEPESVGNKEISDGELPKATTEREKAFPPIERDWTEAGERGRKIRGSVAKLNPNYVLLRLSESGEEKLIKKSQLSKLDLAFLELVPILQNDAIQYEQTRSFWYAMHSGQYPDLKTAKQQLTGFPKSPYGLLMAGIATACVTPDYEQAEGYFEKAYKLLSAKEKLLPDLTPATYVSCCNNYAIVLWREGKSNTAVKLLLEAASVGPRPAEFLIHNARIIQRENSKRPQKFQITGKAIAELVELINKPFVSSAKPLEKEYMHFSLNVDGPPAISDLEELLKLHFAKEKMVDERFIDDQVFGDLLVSGNCPFEPWCMGCGGRGVFRCPGRCNRGIVDVPIRVQGGQGIRGEPIYVTKYVEKACDVCNGRGVGAPCKECNATGKNVGKRRY